MRKLKTIKGKLTGTLLLLVTIALSILVSFIVGSANVKLIAEQKASLKATSNMYAEIFNTFFEEKMSFVEGIANSTITYGQYDDRKTIREAVRGYKELVDDSVADLYIAFADKDLYMMSGSEEGLPADFDARTRSWYIQAVAEKGTIVSTPYVDQVSGNMMITIATPIYKGDTLIGVAAEDVYITELVDITNGINYVQGVYGFLVDQTGAYVSHPNSAFNPTQDNTTTVDEHIQKAIEGAGDVILLKDYAGTNVYVSASNIDNCNWSLAVALPQAYVQNRLSSMIIVAIIFSLVILGIVIFFVPFIIGKSMKPVQKMKEFVRESVIGQSQKKDYKNEVQEIDDLVQEMENHFINTIRQTKKESVQIKDKIAESSSRVSSISESIVEISATMEETGASVSAQTEAIQNINDTCGGIGQGIEELANEAQEMATRANDIIHRVNELVPEMIQNKKETLHMTNTSKVELRQAIEGAADIKEIVEISKAIEEIAEETNLLALNANIEAARAGEAGRGFSVVADQIRSLSENTNREIAKVGNVIQHVLGCVETLSRKSDDMLMFMDHNVLNDYELLEKMANQYQQDASYYSEVSSNLGASSEELSASIQNITNMIESIGESQQNLNEGIQVVNENLQEITVNSEVTTKETAAAAAGVEELFNTVNKFNI